MTIKLLCARGNQPAGAIVTLDAATEAGLVTAKMATTDLTGGVPYIPPAAALAPRFAPRRKVVGCTAFSPPKEASVSTNTTWHLTMAAARAFSGIEVFYAAAQGVDVTYDHTAVAASASLTVPMTPTEPWYVGPSVTLPTTGTTDLPAYGSTGILPCRSVKRIDGRYPLAMIRTHAVGKTPSYASIPNFSTAYDAANPDWPMQVYQTGGGDYCSVNQNLFNVNAPRLNFLIPAMVKFVYDQSGITVLAMGDSLMGGDSVIDGSSGRLSYAFKAIRQLQDEGMAIDLVNCAISGNTFARFGPRGKAFIDMVKPDVVLIPAFTPNVAGGGSYDNQAEIDAQWAACMDLVAYAQAAGCLVILVTPMPDNSTNVAKDNFRLQNRDRAFASGLWVFDVEPLVSNRASPARWLPGMNDNGNGIHYGAQGGSVMGAGLAALLKQILY
ncbi:SGNH/GDSL hydrolase family protein [[Empedobacter] haloabium]|uniref:SGNH/GDSL hydrolase family protein n=1 Tax=[Empedobacter] haloabium TaxID=592317 RepID=A0ABZ1USM6_9BURK